MTVLDTSAVVDFLLGSGVAREVEELLSEGPAAAPDVLVFEVLAVLRRATLRREIPGARAESAVEDLGDLPLDLFPALPLRRHAFELRRNLTAADALFVAIAAELGEPLASRDAGLLDAAARHANVAVVRLGERG